MVNVVVMGECMLELSKVDGDLYRKSYAGDVYNTAVYLKRLAGSNVNIEFLTGVGTSTHCGLMLENFTSQGIGCDWVQIIQDKSIGSYIIDVDTNGERAFSYWRGQSAAKHMFDKLSDSDIQALANTTDVFYFSGISLAILTPSGRQQLGRLLEQLKFLGKQIVFDTNFRPALWGSIAEAKNEFERALQLSDLVFAGVEDLALLEKIETPQQLKARLATYDIPEIIIKDGAKEVVAITSQGEQTIPVQPVSKVVDTTSAGDSFNAGYLFGRHDGQSIERSIQLANAVAGFVIQHQGAIVDAAEFGRAFGVVGDTASLMN